MALTGRTEESEVFQAAMNLGLETDSLLDACEEIYMNGFADRVSGDVESPQGHFYMVGRWIVVTDDRGFHNLLSFEDDREADSRFDEIETGYASWADPDES